MVRKKKKKKKKNHSVSHKPGKESTLRGHHHLCQMLLRGQVEGPTKEFDKMKVIGGFDSGDKTQLEGVQERMDDEEIEAGGIDHALKSLAVKDEGRAAADCFQERLGSWDHTGGPGGVAAQASHSSGSCRTNAKDLVLSGPSHRPSQPTPSLRGSQRPGATPA